MNNRVNISQIENWLHSLLNKVVSDTVVVGTLPSTLASRCKDMVLIEVVESRDRTDFGHNMGMALANVYLYASPTSAGKKSVARLNEMEESINEVIEDNWDEDYTISELYSESDYDTQIKWHYIIKAYRIIIS